MLSVLGLLFHTALIVLAYIYPRFTALFLFVSVIFVLYTYFRRRIFFLFRFGFYKDLLLIFPILFLSALAIYSDVRLFFMWALWGVSLFFGHILPTAKYLFIRLRLYARVRSLIKNGECESDVSLLKCIFCGSRTPYNIFIKSPKKRITVGILGSIESVRYIFGRSTVISQKFGNGKAYMIENIRDVEHFEEDTEGLFPRIGPSFLGRKVQRDIGEICESDALILVLHPNAYIQENERILGMGETIASYRLVSLKTASNILGE